MKNLKIAALAMLSYSALQGSQSQFVFTGLCIDCQNADLSPGTATATLTLQDYAIGDLLLLANFVSFEYSSPWLNYTMSSATGLSGQLLPAPAASVVDLAGPATGAYTALYPFGGADPSAAPFVFSSGSDCGWSTGPFVAGPDDFGGNAQWTAAPSVCTPGVPDAPMVPEPASYAHVLGGLAVCLLAIRKITKNSR